MQYLTYSDRAFFAFSDQEAEEGGGGAWSLTL